jgi:hypothetical protein
VLFVILLLAGLIALAALTGAEMRTDAKNRDVVERLFRDPFRRDL